MHMLKFKSLGISFVVVVLILVNSPVLAASTALFVATENICRVSIASTPIALFTLGAVCFLLPLFILRVDKTDSVLIRVLVIVICVHSHDSHNFVAIHPVMLKVQSRVVVNRE